MRARVGGQDLEEIGLTRVQARRLQAAAAGPTRAGAPDQADEASVPGETPAGDAERRGAGEANAGGEDSAPPRRRWANRHQEAKHVSFVERGRSASPERPWTGWWTADAAQGTARARSASAHERSVGGGRRFEDQCRKRILDWLEGWATELAPKALGIHHDCDLVLRLSFEVPSDKLMPSIFKSPCELTQRYKKDSVLFFEMKRSARWVDHAITQLKTRRELVRRQSLVRAPRASKEHVYSTEMDEEW